MHDSIGEQRSAEIAVERWLLGRLRRRTFYSLAEVNAAIGEMLKNLNEERPIRRLGVTRRKLFEEVDRSALNALPIEPYEYCEWRLRRVGIDYHVEIDAHYYSVPYRFARAEVEARLTVRGVEIFCKGERIAVHLRMSGNRKHTTIDMLVSLSLDGIEAQSPGVRAATPGRSSPVSSI